MSRFVSSDADETADAKLPDLQEYRDWMKELHPQRQHYDSGQHHGLICVIEAAVDMAKAQARRTALTAAAPGGTEGDHETALRAASLYGSLRIFLAIARGLDTPHVPAHAMAAA
jgi:hypothetical protein